MGTCYHVGIPFPYQEAGTDFLFSCRLLPVGGHPQAPVWLCFLNTWPATGGTVLAGLKRVPQGAPGMVVV